MLPSRRLAGVLFGAAGTLWWFLISVLSVLVAPEEPTLSTSFWVGWFLLAASAAGWGAVLARPLVRRARRGASAAGMIFSSAVGVGILLLAGLTALGLSLAFGALVVGIGPVGAALREAGAARPGQLLLPAVSLLLIAAPFGGAAGVALHAMAAPASGGSAGSRLR